MADQLRQIITFTAIPAAGMATLPHNVNSNGTPYIPDEVEVDNGDFNVLSVTSTAVTVQNNSFLAGNCDVLLTLWQSGERALGPNSQAGNFAAGLTPRPFIGAASGGALPPSTDQRFTFTAIAASSDFTVTLPAARASDNYVVLATKNSVVAMFDLNCPDTLAGDRTTTTFRVITSAAVTIGDKIDFLVEDRT